MSSPVPSSDSGSIAEAAAHWLARRANGFTPDEQAAFAAWLAADYRHRAAFAEIDFTPATPQRPAPDHARAAARLHLRRRRFTSVAGGLAAAVALALAAIPLLLPDEHIQFVDLPLGEAITHFNQPGSPRLVLADPALAALRVTGAFRTDRPKEFLRALESAHRLRARRDPSGHLVLSRP